MKRQFFNPPLIIYVRHRGQDIDNIPAQHCAYSSLNNFMNSFQQHLITLIITAYRKLIIF